MSSEAYKSSKSLSRLSPDLLDSNQQKAITAMYEGNVLVVGKMGAGKTVIAATAIAELLDDSVVNRVLIATTPKIADTVWAQEFDKWQQTCHIKVGVATGTPKERLAVINSGCQVVVVTFNILPWLKDNNLLSLFEGFMADETTKLKTTGGTQFKAIRNHLKKFLWRAGLTGTPVSEDFEALFGQVMLIDCGEALGRNKQKFLQEYFYPTDFKQYNWALKPEADKLILDKVKHLVHVLPDYRGELKQPEYIPHKITLPAELRQYYEAMKKDMVTEHAVSQNAAVLIGKLQQIASGFIYQQDGTPERLSDYRLEALKELLKEIGEESTLVAYWYAEDLEALKRELPDAVIFDKANLKEQVKAWNAGKIKTLLIHPRSGGHGLQLEQGGRNIIWYTPYWSRDLWEQLNARLWRKGQTKVVRVYSIEAIDTVDELITQRVENKAEFDRIFTEHLGD